MSLNITLIRVSKTPNEIKEKLKKFDDEFDCKMSMVDAESLARKYGLNDVVRISTSKSTNGVPITIYSNILDDQEIAYFIKHNWIVRYFDYKDNYSNLELEPEKMRQFVDDVRKVVEAYNESFDKGVKLASELVPTMNGYFFGDVSYNDLYFKLIESDADKFEEILNSTDFEKEKIHLHCWW